MDHPYFVSIHRELCLIEEHVWLADQVLGQLRLYRMALRFLERFSGWVATWHYKDARIKERFTEVHCLKHSFMCIWREEGKGIAARLSEIREGCVTDWNVLAWQLKHKLQDSKIVIEGWCQRLLFCSFTHEPPRSDKILILLDAILNNLKDLLSYKSDKTVPPNDQIETLEEKLVFLQNFLKLTANCIYNKDFQELETYIHCFATNAACQTFLYWVKTADEDYATETDPMLSDMLQRIEPCMPDVMAYFRTLRYKASTTDEILIHLDAILKSLKDLVSYKAGKIVPLKKQIETLEHKLVFLQNFLKLAVNCVNSKEFKKFMISVHDFSETAACLTLLYWLKAGDEQITSEMSLKLSDMLQKIEPCTPVT